MRKHKFYKLYTYVYTKLSVVHKSVEKFTFGEHRRKAILIKPKTFTSLNLCRSTNYIWLNAANSVNHKIYRQNNRCYLR